MPPYDEDDDNASNESGSDGHDNDENMADGDEGDEDVEMDDGDEADAEEGDADANENDADDDADADAEDGDGDGAEEDDQDENDDNDDNEPPDTPSIPRKSIVRSHSKAATPSADTIAPAERDENAGEDGQNAERKSRTHSPKTPNARSAAIYIRPSLRPEMITASTYDIIPTIAAPQSTSINAITALPDMRWVFTGGSDGYIRKFNWVDTVNEKLMLTVAQKHSFVESVQKAGVLQSYWENEDPTIRTPVKTADAAPPLSPLYSLAVERQALWLLSGDETGIIKLQTVRHHEGECITTLRKHSSAVSVLVLSPDEKSVLSGGWDKAVHDWDLNTGEIVRSYGSASGQISAIEARPLSTLPVPQNTGGPSFTSRTFSSNNAEKAKANGVPAGNENQTEVLMTDQTATVDVEAHSYDDMDSLFGDDDAGPMNSGLGDDDDDEFSRAIASAPQAAQTGDDENTLDDSIENTKANENIVPDDPKMVVDDKPPAASESKPVEEESAMELEISSDIALPISEDIIPPVSTSLDEPESVTPSSETTFLDASITGTLRIWDRRMPNPLATISPRMGTPPWCMSATWSPDGNYIYVGRRNNCVEEFSLHKGLRDPSRTLRLPGSSQKVSALKAMPNGRHLICASHDIMRLYDLKNQEDESQKQHNVVPFLIIPGHRTGVIAQLYLDPTGRFLITTAGHRGWDGPANPPEVMLGYEVVCIP